MNAHLVMGELVKEASLVHMFNLLHHIAVPTTTSSSNNVLEKCKGNEGCNNQEEDNGTDGTSAFGDLLLCLLGHVDTFEASLDEVGPCFGDQGIGCSKCKA